MADLSYALLENINGENAVFYNAIMKNGVVDYAKPITTFAPEGKGQIFFSMPGCLGKREEVLTKEYKTILESRGYSVVYYRKDDYHEYGQFSKIRESIAKSVAAIAFGFRQTRIENGVALPGTSRESRITDKWLNTSWNEVEVGMAIMRGLPILLVKDDGIESGIFDCKLSECFIASIPSDIDCRNIVSNSDFTRWCNQIKPLRESAVFLSSETPAPQCKSKDSLSKI